MLVGRNERLIGGNKTREALAALGEEVRRHRPSRMHATTRRHVLQFFPDATSVVYEKEAAAYAGQGAELLAHPPEVQGIAPLKNWILDHIEDEVVFIVDDDIGGLKAMADHGGAHRSPIRAIV